MAEAVKVFVSYSWGVEKKTKVVDDLESLCKARGIDFYRDANRIKHGERISEFMSALAAGDHIITVFSDRYFQSEWCMHELLSIMKRGDFFDRVHPISADGIEPSDFSLQAKFIKYWMDHVAEKRAEIADLPDTSKIRLTERIKKYEDIQREIDDLMTCAGDMKITPLSLLQAEGYKSLLDRISPISSSVQPHPNLPENPDSEFRKVIKQKISGELDGEALSVFRDALRDELAVVLKSLGNEEFKVVDPHSITDGLIWSLENGKQQVPVINKVLKNSFMHCFHPSKGKFYQVSKPNHGEIKTAVEQLLGWLVLSSLDETQLSYVSPKDGYGDGVYFELPVETQGGVEVIVSRQHQRFANLAPDGSDVSGVNVICAAADQFSWSNTATSDDLKLMLWNKVFPEDSQEELLNAHQTKILNAELSTRRLDEWDTEHHYIAVQCADDKDKDAHEQIYKTLLTELDQLTLVRFGQAEGQSLFCTLEYSLMSAINRFLNTVNKMV